MNEYDTKQLLCYYKDYKSVLEYTNNINETDLTVFCIHIIKELAQRMNTTEDDVLDLLNGSLDYLRHDGNNLNDIKEKCKIIDFYTKKEIE